MSYVNAKTENTGMCLSIINHEKCSPAKVEIGDFIEVKIGVLVFRSAQKGKMKMSVVLCQITILSSQQRKVRNNYKRDVEDSQY